MDVDGPHQRCVRSHPFRCSGNVFEISRYWFTSVNEIVSLQIQYMGFPGTLGASYVPYLVADSVIAPPEYASAYTEKILFLPRR